MKTTKTKILALILAALMMTAVWAEGDGNIAAMRKAASDAGFSVHNGWHTLSNWTTNSNSKADPKDGFQISVLRNGSNFFGIAVLEFATEEIAKEYVAFANPNDSGFDGSIHRSGVFTVAIWYSLVDEHEAKLMAALEKAGWGKSAPVTPDTPVDFVIQNPAASGENYSLRYNNGALNPVRALWDGAAGNLSVTYTSQKDYFVVPDINEAQNSKLYKHSANGNFHEVRGVTSKITATGDSRGRGSNYGTVVLAFFDGSTPYVFENGVYYAVVFDIRANRHRHRTTEGGNPFVFVGVGSGAVSGNMKTQEEVKALLTNFDISMVFEAQGQEPYHYRQASSDKALFFEMKGEQDMLMFVDFAANKAYDLDAETKTAEVESFTAAQAGMLKSFVNIIAGHLFVHEGDEDWLKIIGSEEIIGRSATVYMKDLREYNAGYTKIWIDDEYGFTLQYEQFESNPMKFRVTEFTVGGVNAAGLVNLNDYKID